MTTFSEQDVELAERYATALETIERLELSISDDEPDVVERYAQALETIEDKS